MAAPLAPARSTTVIGREEVGSLNDLSAAFEWFRALLPKTAAEELAKEQAQGQLQDPITFVDGKKSDNIAGVKIFGNITYVSSLGPIGAAILALATMVDARTPRKTGHYDNSYRWFLNGQQHNGPPKAEDVGATGNVMLLNMTPYASWLEVHYPTGILFGAYTALKRFYGKSVSIAYGYANPDSFGGQAWRPQYPPGPHPYMVPYILLGNPGSTVKPGSTSRGTSNSKRKTNKPDRRAGRGHRRARGIGRGPKAP